MRVGTPFDAVCARCGIARLRGWASASGLVRRTHREVGPTRPKPLCDRARMEAMAEPGWRPLQRWEMCSIPPASDTAACNDNRLFLRSLLRPQKPPRQSVP
jgi:hypothetical protein